MSTLEKIIASRNNRLEVALIIAAEEAYRLEVIDTDMKEYLIGEGKEFSSKEDWIDERVESWLDSAKERIGQ